ncbi:MAG TPA: response regulator, partial [Kofleriaceae bacterium]|nr:response regulator [Kofleriaceae bacterium]
MIAPPRIVVIDDDVSLTPSYQRCLRDFDVACYSAEVGQVIDAIVAQPPDALLLDFFLEETTGGEVIQQLRARDVHIPILLMSGSFDVHRGAHEFSFGA